MNYFVEVDIINDNHDIKIFGKSWCEYSTKKSRLNTIESEVRTRVSEITRISNYRLESGRDYIMSIQKFKKDLHSHFFQPDDDNQDQWILVQRFTPTGRLKSFAETLELAASFKSIKMQIDLFCETLPGSIGNPYDIFFEQMQKQINDGL